jgi:hypothetical protein
MQQFQSTFIMFIQRHACIKIDFLMIEYLSDGQKSALYHNLSFSKYAPNYTTTARSQNSSKIFNFIDRAAQGVKNVLGMEATRQTIYNEMSEVLEFDGSYINYHHMALLVDRMTFSHKIVSVFRHGINNDDIGPIAKASFEETPEMFLKAARHGELDLMKGVSANVMVGQEGYYGTSAFQVFLDMNEMIKLNTETTYKELEVPANQQINQLFEEVNSSNQPCSVENLTIYNNSSLIKQNTHQEFDASYTIF